MKTRRHVPIRIGAVIFAWLLIVVPVLQNRALAAATIKDIAIDATDPLNLSDTEPSIAVNPVNNQKIAVVSFSETWGPGDMAPVWKSSDWGVTWHKVRQIPQPSAQMGGPYDQKIAFDREGKLFIAEAALGASAGDYIYRQTAGPDDALTPGAFYGYDQPHLEVDRSSGQACSGVVYSPWANNLIAIPRSMVSWSNSSGEAMHDIGAGDNSMYGNRTARIALAADGHAYIVYKTREGAVPGLHLPGSSDDDFENVHFRVQRSDDCGQTWNALGGGAGISVHGISTVQTFFTNNFGVTGPGRKVARSRSSDAWIAVNPTTNEVYAAYVSRDASTFGQIYVARSSDQGQTWTSKRVTNGSHHCSFPEIAVAGNGAIGVLYIDFEDVGTNTNFRHHFARSFNDGDTWDDQILQSFDPGPIWNADTGFLWGDYEGLTVAGHTFYGVFTGQSIGRTTTQLDPIFFRDTADLAMHPIHPYLYRLCTIVGCLPFKKQEWYVDPAPDERFRMLVRAGGQKASALKSIQSKAASLNRQRKNASAKQRLDIEASAKRLLGEIKKMGY